MFFSEIGEAGSRLYEIRNKTVLAIMPFSGIKCLGLRKRQQGVLGGGGVVVECIRGNLHASLSVRSCDHLTGRDPCKVPGTVVSSTVFFCRSSSRCSNRVEDKIMAEESS